MKVGLLHPGQMGAAVGAAARSVGHEVAFASAGRSEATRARALAADLLDLESTAALCGWAEVLVSVCPPASAEDVAAQVGSTHFGGLFLDANAISPKTARGLGAPLGERFVDGGLVGGPPTEPGHCRLFLAGPAAPRVAELFVGSALACTVLGDTMDSIGTASALKMCYAAWTKGTTALLLAVRALAQAEGVESALLDEWSRSIPDLPARSQASAGAALKAWRWVGEMEEIASTFEDNGLPGGFHLAAAELYGRLASFKDGQRPEIAAVLRALEEPCAS